MHIPRVGTSRLIAQILPVAAFTALHGLEQSHQPGHVDDDACLRERGDICCETARASAVVPLGSYSGIRFHEHHDSTCCVDAPQSRTDALNDSGGGTIKRVIVPLLRAVGNCETFYMAAPVKSRPFMTMSNEIPSTTLSALDICNIALSKLGEAPILSLDANGCTAARLCYMHYHPVRREVLCACRWSFAKKDATLTSPNEDESGLHMLPHTLPQDCLRVLAVNAPSWTLRGRSVFCPQEVIRLLYIADIEDTSLFEPLFTEAIATRLACKLSVPLLSSVTARKALTDEYNHIVLPQAAYANAVQDHSNDTHPLYHLWRASQTHHVDMD